MIKKDAQILFIFEIFLPYQYRNSCVRSDLRCKDFAIVLREGVDTCPYLVDINKATADTETGLEVRKKYQPVLTSCLYCRFHDVAILQSYTTLDYSKLRPDLNISSCCPGWILSWRKK